MNYGYPGSNSQFENHKVSEESFWPSFTDIMMVIVMVFLLVTVAVILNNWTLISKLTNSIEAQQAATNLADNRQLENINLEKKLSKVQQNLLLLNSQFDREKAALEKTQKRLSTAAQALSVKEESLASIENKLTSLNAKYLAEQQRLNNTTQQLNASELKLSNSDKELLKIKELLSTKIVTITSLKKNLQATEKQKTDVQKNLEISQTNLEKIKNDLAASEAKFSKTDQQLVNTKELLSSKITVISNLDKKLQDSEKQKSDIQSKLVASEENLAITQESLVTTKDNLLTTQESLVKAQENLVLTEKNLVTAKENLTTTEKNLVTTKETLAVSEENLIVSKESLIATEENLEETKLLLAEEQEKLTVEQKKLLASMTSNSQFQSVITDLEKEKQSLNLLNQNNKEEIDKNIIALANVKNQLEKSKLELSELEKTHTEKINEIEQLKLVIANNKKIAEAAKIDRNIMDKKLIDLLSLSKSSEKMLVDTKKESTKIQNELLEKLTILEKDNVEKTKLVEAQIIAEEKLKSELAMKDTEVQELLETTKAVEAAVSKSENSLKSFEDLLTKAEQQILAKNTRIEQLLAEKEAGSTQLISLQGEYDTLDNKYQKLLRPARSSKGKYVASVTYKKVGNKKIIRYKSNPTGSYKTVSESELQKSLEALKRKHKKNLYIKVVIPQNSGLSYNEAWRFTINLQQKYDYYYNN